MPAGSDGGWLQLVRRGAEPVSTGVVAASVLALPHNCALVPILSPIAGWGLKETVDRGLDKLQQGSDEYAKLEAELKEANVTQVAHKLDIRTDVPEDSCDLPGDCPQFRRAYEKLSDKLADAHLVLAHRDRHNKDVLDGRRCSAGVAKPPPLDVLPQPGSLQAAVQELCKQYSPHLVPLADADRSFSRRDFSDTPRLPDLEVNDHRTEAGNSKACDGTYQPAKHFCQHEGLVHDIREEMAKVSVHNIGIVGMGGIGKTALACEVFKAAEVAQPGHVKYLARAEALGVKFHKKVWLTVTNKPDFKKLIESAFRQLFDRPGVTHILPFDPSLHDRGLRDLVLRVKQENLRVLLVLDDVWLSRKHSVVDALNFATRPEICVPGSRLIITTRQRGALSYNGTDLMNADTLRILQAPPLSRESAWQLFEHHTMGPYQGTHWDAGDPHPFSEDVRDSIQSLMDKLDGNALAIVDLGDCIGYVRQPQREGNAQVAEQAVIKCLEEYKRKLTDVSGPCDKASQRCAESVSTAALSPSMRDCFTACAAFPEDEEVSESVLLHLFATRSPLHAPRAVDEAGRKLAHLVHCSILRVHASEDGGPPTYSMHRILHRIAVWLAKQKCKYTEQHLYHFHAPRSLKLSAENGTCIRYLSAHEGIQLETLLCETDTPPELRALIISNVKRSPASPAWPLRLRFMHLRGALRLVPKRFQAVPRANLLLLNFLSLAGSTHTDAMIKAILPAPYLRHLDLSGCIELKIVPDAIGDCSQLTHLDLSGCVGLTDLPQSPKVSLPASLAHFILSGCTGLARLPHLTQPTIPSETRWTAMRSTGARYDGTQHHLTHLNLSGCQLKELDVEILEIFKCCSALVSLHLTSCEHLTTVPDLNRVCGTLQHLDLRGCAALQGLPPTIGRCSELARLVLDGCCNLTALPWTIMDCKNLSHLSISECACLKSHLEGMGIDVDCSNVLRHADLCTAFAAARQVARTAMDH